MANWKGIVGKPFTQHGFDKYVASIAFHGWRPEFVVLHNTASPKLSEWHKVSGAHRMAGLQSYYRDTQKWSAGPHLFVADDFIWVFTPLTTHGIHSPSWNSISWGVEVVGDYATEKFIGGVRSNTLHALVTLHCKVGLNPESLRFHKEDPKTTHHGCPGTNINKHDIISGMKLQMISDVPRVRSGVAIA